MVSSLSAIASDGVHRKQTIENFDIIINATMAGLQSCWNASTQQIKPKFTKNKIYWIFFPRLSPQQNLVTWKRTLKIGFCGDFFKDSLKWNGRKTNQKMEAKENSAASNFAPKLSDQNRTNKLRFYDLDL